MRTRQVRDVRWVPDPNGVHGQIREEFMREEEYQVPLALPTISVRYTACGRCRREIKKQGQNNDIRCFTCGAHTCGDCGELILTKPISAHFKPSGCCEQFGEGKSRIRKGGKRRKKEEAPAPGVEAALARVSEYVSEHVG